MKPLMVQSTAACLESLGVRIERGPVTWVHGVGLAGLREAPGPLDCAVRDDQLALQAPADHAMKPLAVQVPGDKSIAHRALVLGALAEGESTLRGLAAGLDVRSTPGALGVRIERGAVTRVHGVGLAGLREAPGPLDRGNSGTTMRLPAGILAGAQAPTTLDGDDSLRGRPMRLAAMGARRALFEMTNYRYKRWPTTR